MQKEWTQKTSRKHFLHFQKWLQKKKWSKKFGSTREQNLLESVRNCAKLREYWFNSHWLSIRLHLLNLQYEFWNFHFTLLWQNLVTSTFTKCFNSSQPSISERNARQTWYRRLPRSLIFANLYSKPQRECRKPKFEIWHRMGISKYYSPFRNCYKPQLTQDIFAFVAFFSRKTPTYTKKAWTRWHYPC